jgi:hypothetical protein
MKRFLLSTAAAAAVGVLALVALEVGLRAAGFSAPVWYQPDAKLGWALRPGVKAWYTEEGRGYVWINPAGFRDRSHEVLKPSGTFRVAILGGENVEAMPVSFRDTFWWQLEDRLQRCARPGASAESSSRQVEVMNFGVSGYGIAQDAALLQGVAARYQPDLVLLAFAPAQEVADNLPGLANAQRGPFAGRRPQPWELLAWQAGDRSRIAQLGNLAWQRLASRREGASARAASSIDGRVALAPPRDAAWISAWSATARQIEKVRSQAAGLGARFAVVVLTDPVQVSPDPAARQRLQDALGADDLFYAERRIGELGSREGFEVIALAPELQKRAQQTRAYFHGFRASGLGEGRWNESGHQAAAEILSRKLCEALDSRFIR